MFHTRQTIQRRAPLAIGLLALTCSPALALDYVFSDMGGLSNLVNPISTRGINNLGHVAGFQGEAAVVWNGSAWNPLPNLAGTSSSQAWGLNDVGQVVGHSVPAGVDAAIPVRWHNGVPTQLDSLVQGVNYDFPAAINNSGQVLGMYWTGTTVRPATWAAGGTALTELPTLGGTSGYAWYNAINDAGDMVAPTNTADDDALRATAYVDGVAHDLGTLGGLNSEASGINNSGQIVGVANNADDTPRPAFLEQLSVGSHRSWDLGRARRDGARHQRQWPDCRMERYGGRRLTFDAVGSWANHRLDAIHSSRADGRWVA